MPAPKRSSHYPRPREGTHAVPVRKELSTVTVRVHHRCARVGDLLIRNTASLAKEALETSALKSFCARICLTANGERGWKKLTSFYIKYLINKSKNGYVLVRIKYCWVPAVYKLNFVQLLEQLSCSHRLLAALQKAVWAQGTWYCAHLPISQVFTLLSA